MSEDVKNLDAEYIQEQASEEVLNDEEQVVEGTEEEVVEETQSEESVEDLEEAKVKKEMDHEEESVQPKAVDIPKTKAGVIQAAVDMLKSARKEDAQKLFEESETEDLEDFRFDFMAEDQVGSFVSQAADLTVQDLGVQVA